MAGVGSRGEVLCGPESGVGMGTTSGYTASASPRRVHFLNLAIPGFRPCPGHMSGSTQGPAEQGLSSQSSRGAAVEPVSSQVATPLNTISMALFAQQLPTLPNFNGDHVDGDGESVDDWLERLEQVGRGCSWDDQARLVNVATRLRGEASRFYQSCTPQQRSTYSALMAALRKQLTPVRIQCVQSSRFHERRQRPGENVDSYAQELRKLPPSIWLSPE